jgi:hypothetical protein
MKVPIVIFAATVLLIVPYASAHHSVLPFDGNRPTTIRGTLRRIDWRNPHVYLQVAVGDATGVVWTIEAESPLLLERLGWRKAQLIPEHPISVLGAPSKDGKRLLRCRTVTLDTGTTLPCFPLHSD